VLILDEPTNHLDLESRESLEAALQAFEGSLILVSHDRALLDAVGSRTVAVEDRALHSYVGGWPEYVRVREERARGAAAPAKPVSRRERAAKSAPARNNPNRAPRARKRYSAADQQRLEQEIEQAEAALHALEDELADPAAWSGADASARSTARHEQAKRAVEELYERWEQVAG
jgi:ATP-binding cassette, subfamily F, member 3